AAPAGMLIDEMAKLSSATFSSEQIRALSGFFSLTRGWRLFTASAPIWNADTPTKYFVCADGASESTFDETASADCQSARAFDACAFLSAAPGMPSTAAASESFGTPAATARWA